MTARSLVVFLLCLTVISPRTGVAGHTLHVGPVSVGTGGSNPVSIPPLNPLEYEWVWTTTPQTEWTFGLCPGLFYGRRHTFSSGGAYVSLGGGLVTSALGGGPGLYSAFGVDRCGSGAFCFNLELKQAVGLGFPHLLFSSAIRIGVTWKT